MRNSPKTIRVTFKDTDLENNLHDEILKSCEIIGQSAWMKQAAIEKLEREKQGIEKVTVQSTKANNSIISSLDDLFK